MNAVPLSAFSPEALAERLQAAEPWSRSGGAEHLLLQPAQLRELTQAMLAAQARFVTITAIESDESQELLLDYYWDLAGRLFCFTFPLPEKSIASIHDLCPAVDWIEREVRDGWAIEFTGRQMEPLLLRQGDKPGVNLRKEAE